MGASHEAKEDLQQVEGEWVCAAYHHAAALSSSSGL